MWKVSEETGRFFTVHQNRRWDEDFLTVKKILDEHTLGEVYRIESRVHGSRGIPGDWRGQKEYGGGMVLDWGVHLLDQIMLLKEGTPLTRVYSWITNVTNQEVDDGFTTMLTFADGLQVLVEVGTSNFTNLPRWYVLGDNGTAILNDFKPRGEIVRAQGMNETDIVPVQTAAGLTKTMAPRRDDTIFHEELPKVESDVRDFYNNVMDVIENGAEPIVKLPQVMRVMKLMEMIFESASTGEAIVCDL
jgi:predicted dehydrogenase